MGNNNDVRLFLISNNQGLYVISQNSKSSNPIIYKYVFNSSQLTFKTISSYAGYGHGPLMLSDTHLFLLAADSTSSGDLYFNKLSYESTVADWTRKLSLPTSLCDLKLSETLLSSDKTKLHIFPAYGNPRYLYFMSIRLTDGGKVDIWNKSNLSVDKVFGSAQYGNYIVIAADCSPNNCLMLVDLSKSTFNLKGFTGGNLKQVGVDPSTGRFIVMGQYTSSTPANGYIGKFIFESIQMLTEFGYSTTSITSYDPASNYLSASSAILSAELTGTFCVSSQITRSNPTHTSASISTSDVNFQINDQSFSVASENKFQTIPDLTCAALGSTKTITYTINDYPGYSITSWVSIDSVSGQLTINAPSVTSDKLYKFYVNSAISTLSSPIQKTILLTVTSCKVANCQTCSSSSSSACSVCVTNYSLSSGACLTSYSSSSVPSSETNNHTAKTLGLVSASIIGAVSCVVVLSSLMSTSSMTSLWSLINQVQIFFLLLLSRTFIPDDVQNVITGPKFALNPLGYIPFDYFNLYRSLVNVFDFRLSNSLLDLLEIKSDSTIYNCSSLISTTIICVLFHSIIYLLNKCCSRSQPNENTSKCAKVTKWLISKVFIFLTFGFYIRICLEMNQYLLVSSINEIHQFNFHEGLRITSLVVAFLVLALCLSLMTASLYLICSSYKTVENQHNKLEEFFAGLKPNKKHRFYASVLLFRRTLFVSVLLVFDSTSPEVLVIVLSVVQLIYSVYLIILRPFEEVKSCIIEILNEIYTLTLFVTLIFLNTKEEWGSTKTLAFVWVLSSNSMMTFIIVFIDSIRMLVKKCMKKNSVANKVPRTTTNQIPPRMKQMQKQQMNSNLRIESNQDQSINGLKEENKVDFYKKQTKSPIYHSRMNL